MNIREDSYFVFHYYLKANMEKYISDFHWGHQCETNKKRHIFIRFTHNVHTPHNQQGLSMKKRDV